MAKRIRTEGKTPNGGDYSEIVFFDAEGNIVDEEFAVRCVVRECLKNGELVKETWASK